MTVSLMKKQLGLVYLLALRFSLLLFLPPVRVAVLGQAALWRCLGQARRRRRVGFD